MGKVEDKKTALFFHSRIRLENHKLAQYREKESQARINGRNDLERIYQSLIRSSLKALDFFREQVRKAGGEIA